MTDAADLVVQPDLEVKKVFEVTGISTTMLLENVGAGPRSVEDGDCLAGLTPLRNVFTVEVEDVTLVIRRSAMVHHECVAVKAFRHLADECGFTDAVGTGDDNEHSELRGVRSYYDKEAGKCSTSANKAAQVVFVEVLEVDEHVDGGHHGSAFLVDEVDLDVLRAATVVDIAKVVVYGAFLAHWFFLSEVRKLEEQRDPL